MSRNDSTFGFGVIGKPTMYGPFDDSRAESTALGRWQSIETEHAPIQFHKTRRSVGNGPTQQMLMVWSHRSGLLLDAVVENYKDAIIHTLKLVSRELPSMVNRALVAGRSQSFKSTGEKFEALAERWSRYNSGRSLVDYNHLSHLQIIGMGRPALPYLLARLAKGDGRWLYAIKCISGEQIILPEMGSDPEQIIEAWILWGKRNGYI